MQNNTQRSFVQLNKGILTERSEASFPEGYTVDELNMDPQLDGTIKRRLGVAVETGTNSDDFVSIADNVCNSVHKWTNVNNDPDLSFTVVQNGLNLAIYDDNKSTIGDQPVRTVATVYQDYCDTDNFQIFDGDLFSNVGSTLIDTKTTATNSRYDAYDNDKLAEYNGRCYTTGHTWYQAYDNPIRFNNLASDEFFQTLAAEPSWRIYDKDLNILADADSISAVAADLDAAFDWGTFPTAAESETEPVIFILEGWLFFDFHGFSAGSTDGVLVGWDYVNNTTQLYLHGSNNSLAQKYPVRISDGVYFLNSNSGWTANITFSGGSWSISSFTNSYLSDGWPAGVADSFSYYRTAWTGTSGHGTWITHGSSTSNTAYLIHENESGTVVSYNLANLDAGMVDTISTPLAWLTTNNEIILWAHDGSSGVGRVAKFALEGGVITLQWSIEASATYGLTWSSARRVGLIMDFDGESSGYVYVHDEGNNYIVVDIDDGTVTESGTTAAVSTYTNYDDGTNDVIAEFWESQNFDPKIRKLFTGYTYLEVNNKATSFPMPVDSTDIFWENPQEFCLQSTNLNGELILASPGIRTLRLQYEEELGFILCPIRVQFRDFAYADIKDRYLSERPTSDFTAAVAYDIINHGWSGKNGGLALEKYIAARGLLPPLNLRWYSSKDEYGEFDVGGFFNLLGNTSLTSGGHFILDLYEGNRQKRLRTSPFNPDWNYYSGNQADTTQLNDYDYTTQNPELTSTLQALKITAGNGNLKDDTFADGAITALTTSRFYAFPTYMATVPTFAEYLDTLLGKDKASWQLKDFLDTAGTSSGVIFDYLKMYETRYYVTPVKDGADLEPILPTVSGDTPEFDSTVFNADECYAIDVDNRTLEFVTDFTGTVTSIPETTRFKTVETFANRLFYSGLTSKLNTNKVFFSQVLEGNNRAAGRCYQEADPTDETFSDLLPTDGGVITIAGARNITQLHEMKDRLLVLAENGVWSIRGINGSFDATGFVVEKISNVGIDYDTTYVSANDRPYWWSTQGIYTVSFSEEAGTLDAANITQLTIQDFYENISPSLRVEAKGFYDETSRKVVWAYGDGSSGMGEFNKFLFFDEQTQAFTPWTISDATSNSPKVIGMTSRSGISTAVEEVSVVDSTGAVVQDSSGNTVVVERAVQSIVADEFCLVVKNGDNKIEFAFFNSSTYTDWGDNTFDSYIETPYDWQGDITIKKQAEYCTIMARVTETGFELDGNSNLVFANPSGGKFSCFWDFRTDASMTDQVFYRLKRYPVPEGEGDVTMPETITTSRMRLKGRGRVVRLRFDAEDNKEMHLVGYEMIGLRNNRY